jgi:hypothetical protein
VEICGDMTIELTTPAAAKALADYLRRCGCTVDFVDPHVVEVMLPARLRSERDAMLELHAYLRVWRAMHPEHAITSVTGA